MRLKHTLQLYIAPRIENAVFNWIEGDKTKIFCKVLEVTYEPSMQIDEEYIKTKMKRSKESYEKGEEDYWVAATGYMENFFKENEESIIVT